MGNPGFARFEVQGIQIQVYRFCDLSYNLGQNKMEQQTPIPPKSRMKRREGQKRAIFLSLILGGGGGGLGFPFILSKIVRRRLVACELDADSLLAGKLLIKLNLAYILLLLFMNFLAFLF